MKKQLVLLVALSLCSSFLHAQAPESYYQGGERRALTYFVDGNGLHKLCEESPDAAWAYVLGKVDAILTEQYYRSPITPPAEWGIDEPKPPTLCLPENATSKQLRDVVCLYLAKHPEERHLKGGTLVSRALTGVFPCAELEEHLTTLRQQ
jgi:hypothetical protein